MELIDTETGYSRPQDNLLSLSSGTGSGGSVSLLDTVIFNPVPTEPTISTWELSQNTGLPTLVITEQPKQRGMRFRYQCEGRSAGSILGENSTEHTKTLPAIELLHCEGIREVHVSVCLVWKDPPYRIHPHGLVGKDCHDGICEITLHPEEGEKDHSFSNLGIQCVRKREIETSVKARLSLGIDPYNAGMWRHHEEVDLNVVRLCFQAWYFSPTRQRMIIEPVLSEPVYDKKSTNTSELKIYRMNKEYGRCEGGEEIYILCDKVQKEDIQVMFMENSKWEARGDFSQADVHRQIAIVLKTPPYRDLHIKDPATVQVCLQRITDGIRSDPVEFTYMPRDGDSYKVCRKRPRLSTLDEISGPDLQGIEERERKAWTNYTDNLNHSVDFGLESLQGLAFNGLAGPPISQDDSTFIEDTQGNFEIYTSYLGLAETAASFDLTETNLLEDLHSFTEDEATASLVGYSLNLTGEQERQYSDCAYQDDSRMGGS
ncbi:transcription factor RelB [Gastrophryne carolinensis]